MCELFPLDIGADHGTGTTQLVTAVETFRCKRVQIMRFTHRSFLGIGCLLSLAGACSNNANTDGGGDTTPTNTTPQAGTSGSGGSSSSGTTAGSGSNTMSGGMTNTGNGSTAGSGSSMMSGGTTGGSAGMSAGAAGSGSGSPNTSNLDCSAAGPAKSGMCMDKATGVFAVRTEVDVWYTDEVQPMNPLLDPGRGKLTIWFRGEIQGVCEDGSNGVAIMHPCGTILPPLYSDLAAGVVQITFPDELWEKSGIPDYTTVGSTTGFEPGEMLNIAKTAGLLGIKLTDVNASWPSYENTATFDCGGMSGEACFPDQDEDGNPGVTVSMNSATGAAPNPGYMPTAGGEWKYIPAPVALDPDTSNGAADAYIGLRTRLGGSGTISADCSSGVGTGDVDDFESRVYNCKRVDGTECTVDEASFVDQNTPIFHVLKKDEVPPLDKWQFYRLLAPSAELNMLRNTLPSEGPITSVVRLGDVGQQFSCADVRNAAYPMQ